ncbi:Peptidase S74 domain-containing protein [Cupriavidus oxalaticus]|uniref:tail fiber domain-containing protein n=1 Tax=Cupriavidus oxalaticus TaxID=96344 RepID=UPI003F73CDEE
MTTVTFPPDLGGDDITIDDTDNPTTGLANGGHRTRFMIALQQLVKVALWVKNTAATVLADKNAAAGSASQAQNYAAAAQAAAGLPALAGKENSLLLVNASANGVTWTQTLPALTVTELTSDTVAGKILTLTHSVPMLSYVESDQTGATGVFRTLVDGGTWRLDRNTAAGRDFSTIAMDYQVNSAGRHLVGPVADDGVSRWQCSGNVKVIGDISATGNVAGFSDRRLKDEIELIDNPLDRISRIRGYTFRRVDLDGMRQTGVIAQEVLEAMPEAVVHGGEHLAVAYGNLVGLAFEGINALAEEVRLLRQANERGVQ